MVYVGYRLTDQYVQRYRYKYQYMYVRVHVYGNAYPEYQNLYIRVYERRMCIQVLVRAAAEARPIQYYSSMLTPELLHVLLHFSHTGVPWVFWEHTR